MSESGKREPELLGLRDELRRLKRIVQPVAQQPVGKQIQSEHGSEVGARRRPPSEIAVLIGGERSPDLSPPSKE